MCKLCSKDEQERNDGKAELNIELRHLGEVQEIIANMRNGLISPHGQEVVQLQNAARRVIKDLSQYI